MRYDCEVNFIKDGSKIYDESTGNHVTLPGTQVTKWVNVSDLGEDRKKMLFGNLNVKAKVIRIQGVYTDKFDSIALGTSKYVVESAKHFRNESVFYVGEKP